MSDDRTNIVRIMRNPFGWPVHRYKLSNYNMTLWRLHKMPVLACFLIY